MKRYILSLLLCIITTSFLWSQTLSPKVISSSSGYSTGSGISLSWTMGEPFNATLHQNNITLSQGQQQPEIEIITTSVPQNTFCVGNTFNITFTSTGILGSENIFTAQLSNAVGSFANPVNIGTLTSNISGNITATIPLTTLFGTAYRIRIISNLPVYIGLDNGSNITINPAPTPLITGSPSDAYYVHCTNVITYCTPYIAGHLYSWSGFGSVTVTNPSQGNCIEDTFINPCGVYGAWPIIVTETDPTTGCSTTYTKNVYIQTN